MKSDNKKRADAPADTLLTRKAITVSSKAKQIMSIVDYLGVGFEHITHRLMDTFIRQEAEETDRQTDRQTNKHSRSADRGH